MKRAIFITKCVLVVLFLGLFYAMAYNAGKHKAFVESAEYYVHTEALLDSINNWDESFMNTVMETDVYYDYEIAKQNLR